MNNINVNTDAVSAAASRIGRINAEIKSSFSIIDNEIKAISSYWDGGASEHALSELHALKSNYYEARFKVMNEYVEFLNRQINVGYVQTEMGNISLADAFK